MVKGYFLSMYRCYMVMLYDMNYIDDPSRLNTEQIIKSILDLGIEDLYTYTGRLELTSSHLLFALHKNKNDDEKREFLECLYNAIKYKEYASKVDTLYEEYNGGNDSSVIPYTMYPRGARIVQDSGIDFDEAFARCISSFDEETHYISINDTIYKLALKELGIPLSEICDEGLFAKGLTYEEEVTSLEGILNGYFVVNGKYSKVLKDWLLTHRWNIDSKHRADTKGLYDYIFCSYVRDVELALEEAIAQLDDYKVLAVQIDKIYYNTPRNELVMPIGVFTVVCDDDAYEYLLPDLNNINGYTGEVYSESRLYNDGIDFVGCPISLSTGVGVNDYFYDLEQTSIKSDTWFNSDDTITIVFNEDYNANNPFAKGTLQHSIYEGYIESLRGSKGLIKTVSVKTLNGFEKAKKDVQRYISTLEDEESTEGDENDS